MPRPSVALQLVLGALLLPSILFLTAPISILTGNEAEITFYRTDLHMVWLLFAVSSTLIAALLLSLREGARPLALRLIGALAVNVVVWNIAFTHVWAHTPVQLALLAAAELGLFAATLWVLHRLPFLLVLRMIAIFAVLNTAHAAYENSVLASDLPDTEEAASRLPVSAPADSASEAGRFNGNVYHIVLDAFSREYLAYRLRNGDDLGLDGYTFYEKAISSYGRTNVSMRSIFRGSLHGEDFMGWGNGAFTDGFTKDLSENGIQQYFFPFYSGYCNEAVVVCDATQDLYAIYRNDAGKALLADLVFLKALPVSLRDFLMGSLGEKERDVETWDYGFSLSSWWRARREGEEDEYPLWRRPIQALTINTLAEFKAMEPGLSATGRYVYLHIMVPHGPLSFDSDCNFLDPKLQAGKDRRQAMEDHADCAVNVVRQISRLLEDLGRFDDSLIIVHSDHGTGATYCSWWNPDFALEPGADRINRNEHPDQLSRQQVGCLAHALLLVKAPGQKTFEISSKPLQMIDIAPTVLDYFDLPHGQYPGVSAISDDPVPDRETVYFESETNELTEIDYFAKYLLEDGSWRFEGRLPVGKDLARTSVE